MSQGVSFAPKDQGKASKWDGGPGTLNTLRAVVWDYNGSSEPKCFVHANITGTEDGKERDEYFGVGDLDKFSPSEDGLKVVPKKKGALVSDSCNFAHLINSLVAAGFDPDKIGDDLSIFDDMDAVFARTKITRTIKGESKDSDPLLVAEITRMPGEKKKVAGKPAVAGKATSAAAAPKAGKAAAAPDVDEQAQDLAFEVLGEQEGPISRKKLSQLVFAKAKKEPNVKDLMNRTADPEFLGADGRPWSYDADAETVVIG